MLSSLCWPLPVAGYGGTERVIHTLAQGLAELGHQVTVAALRGTRSDHYPVLELPVRPARHRYRRQDYVGAARWLASRLPPGVELVHGHSAGNGRRYQGDGAGELRRHVDLPVLVTTHGLGERILPAATAATSFISRSQGQGYGLTDFDFVHNPINPAEYEYREQKGDYLLWMSRIDWAEKGFANALELARRTGRRMVVAGPGMGWLQRWRLPSNVEYVGEVSGRRKALLLAEARAFLHTPLPEWREPFGMVFIEANLSGTPVLTLRTGAADEVVGHGTTGFVCRDLDELIASLDRLGEIDPRACRAWVLERFHYHVVARRYLELYRKVVEAHRAARR
jgi:glycosyltransferase involved in cell wall biosynthesis